MVRFFFVHLIASLLIVLSYKLFLLKYFKKDEYLFYLFMLLLCYFFPFLGAAFGFFIVIAIFRLYKKYRIYPEVLDDSMNLNEIKPLYAKYGLGGANRRLLKTDESSFDRTEALFSLVSAEMSRVNKTLSNLLPDSSDEIRLLSYNILDQQEAVITEDINELLALLKQPVQNSVTIAKLEKNIALLYWELCYRHLSVKELEELMLTKAEHFARSALKVLSKDATLFALLAKISLRSQKYNEAIEAFHQTIRFNISPMQVLPYLAEIQFKLKDYLLVQEHLDESDTLLDIPLVAPVKRFWDQT